MAVVARAQAYGIPRGGAMPLGFVTEDGPRPDYAELYGAVELPTPSYPERTRGNVAGLGRRDDLVRRPVHTRGHGHAQVLPEHRQAA